MTSKIRHAEVPREKDRPLPLAADEPGKKEKGDRFLKAPPPHRRGRLAAAAAGRRPAGADQTPAASIHQDVLDERIGEDALLG